MRKLVQRRGGSIFDLDDDDVLAAVQDDPAALTRAAEPVLIDEYQRLPSLLRVLKRTIDTDTRPGRFIVTGSVTAEALPLGSETLAGRSHGEVLLPLAQTEIARSAPVSLIDRLFEGLHTTDTDGTLKRIDYVERCIVGGFPLAVLRIDPTSRSRWLTNYADTLARRDLTELGDVRNPTALPRLIRIVASRTATPLNLSNLARDADLPPSTAARYLSLLDKAFVTWTVPAWSERITDRDTKSPKVHLIDSGLAAAILGASVASPTALIGQLLETFVALELRKQTGWSTSDVEIFHYRYRERAEVDLVIERRDGAVIGVEIKSSTSVSERDFAGLEFLRDRVGDRFVAGVVLFTGTTGRRHGDRLAAVPLERLWS